MTYDGNKPARWEDCPWVPTHIRHEITKRKIRMLKAISQNLLDMHNSRVHQLTPQQREQLRDRG